MDRFEILAGALAEAVAHKDSDDSLTYNTKLILAAMPFEPDEAEGYAQVQSMLNNPRDGFDALNVEDLRSMGEIAGITAIRYALQIYELDINGKTIPEWSGFVMKVKHTMIDYDDA